jgi:O-acetyl-ADP-ribose deacetylase (regulator of RNase III)
VSVRRQDGSELTDYELTESEVKMIKYVAGDILLSKAGMIAHGVAPNDDFGQGLALSLRKNWPAMYKDFRHYCQTSHPKAGELWVWSGAGGIRVANLMTQEAAYGHGERPGKATLPNVRHCLKALHQLVTQEGVTSLAISRLATGVGGLDWEEVKPVIEEHLGSLTNTTVYVYETYVAGQAAEEHN